MNTSVKAVKAYGRTQGDGMVQLTFVLPVAFSKEATEWGRQFGEKMGLEKVEVMAVQPMGSSLTSFVLCGSTHHSIDISFSSQPPHQRGHRRRRGGRRHRRRKTSPSSLKPLEEV